MLNSIMRHIMQLEEKQLIDAMVDEYDSLKRRLRKALTSGVTLILLH
jgi:hypothetical protein